MNKFEAIDLKVENKIAVITVTRPEALNALNAQVLHGLSQVLRFVEEEVKNNFAVRCVIITGSGEKAFVAGADIKEIDQLGTSAKAKEFAANGMSIFARFEKLKIPVIAAVNGFALGGGCELALSADFIIASSNAKFGLPECTLGIMPGFGGTVRLPRRIGVAKAKELAMTGSHITASEALQLGLVNHVVDTQSAGVTPDALMVKAQELARQMCGRAPLALAAIKKSMQEGQSLAQANAEELEAELFGELFGTQDQKEGTKAFIEKRKPAFTGA